MALTVAVDAAVSLLDADEAPRDVEVDELVALGVEVHTLGRDVAGDEHADRARRELEGLDDLLLLDVIEAAVQDGDLVGL